jgi:hypothetical protein
MAEHAGASRTSIEHVLNHRVVLMRSTARCPSSSTPERRTSRVRNCSLAMRTCRSSHWTTLNHPS